jgi:hypothetical protein
MMDAAFFGRILSGLLLLFLTACAAPATVAPAATVEAASSPTTEPATPTVTETPLPTSTRTAAPVVVSLTPRATLRPDHLLFPDAEIVYSATALDFDTAAYLSETDGFLGSYEQYLMLTDWTTAADIVEMVALENSINPRLLLALLEYQGGCVLGQPEAPEHFETVMGAKQYYRKDLYGQLVWTARTLSKGFYGWLDGSLISFSSRDDTILRPDPRSNAGTVALSYFFAQLHDREGWQTALDPEDGFAALYENMFGDPWGRVGKIGELLPVELEQPSLTLPFEPGETWAYTGGPHAAFEGNGPLAGLDFAPQTAESGCIPSNEWVVAMADGLVVRSEYGVVVQDLDGDGFEQTGWNLVYVHIGEEERVPLGVSLRAGERIGHPSCEGGRATGTHLHIARKYNGVWIPADGPCPFVLDGWLTQAGEQPYLGTLRRGLKTVTAHEFGSAVSLITRDVFTEAIDWPKNCPACRE